MTAKGTYFNIDLNKIQKDLARIKRHLPRNTAVLYPVKSFSNRHFLRKIAPYFDGFDVSNAVEFKKVTAATQPKFLSISLVNFMTPGNSFLVRNPIGVLSVESIEDFHFFKSRGYERKYVIRLNSWEFLNGRNKGRFGMALTELQQIAPILSNDPYFCGFSLHHGTNLNTYWDYILISKKIIDTAKQLSLKIRILNLGGGQGNFTVDDIIELGSALKKIVPKNIQVILEPGAFWFKRSTHCVAEVTKLKNDSCMLRISKIAHFRWSNDIKMSAEGAKHRRFKVYGPTCSESDFFGRFRLPREIKTGDHVIISNIKGYSLELNCDFNGIKKIPIYLSDGKTQKKIR